MSVKAFSVVSLTLFAASAMAMDPEPSLPANSLRNQINAPSSVASPVIEVAPINELDRVLSMAFKQLSDVSAALRQDCESQRLFIARLTEENAQLRVQTTATQSQPSLSSDRELHLTRENQFLFEENAKLNRWFTQARAHTLALQKDLAQLSDQSEKQRALLTEFQEALISQLRKSEEENRSPAIQTEALRENLLFGQNPSHGIDMSAYAGAGPLWDPFQPSTAMADAPMSPMSSPPL